MPTKGWKNIVTGKELEAKQDTSYVRFNGPPITDVSITIKPFEIAIVQEP
jgi:hypothetical protein